MVILVFLYQFIWNHVSLVWIIDKPGNKPEKGNWFISGYYYCHKVKSPALKDPWHQTLDNPSDRPCANDITGDIETSEP